MDSSTGCNARVDQGETAQRTEEFVRYLRAGGLVEVDDWMPSGYRRSLVRFIELHAHSEYMGALLEREWLSRAPTLARKLALAAKVQDEIGHAQLLFRLLADLDRPTEDALEDLVHGRSKYHWFFHYRAETWADTGIIAWLSDTAASIAQADLATGSYAPYRRALAKICWEERFHITHGHDIIRTLCEGTAEQRQMAQSALDRWWPRLLAFNGPPTPRERDPNITDWCIKRLSNEEMRQRFLSKTVRQIQALGLHIADPNLAHDAATGRWKYTEPDWDLLQTFKLGHGPETRAWLALRAEARSKNGWVLETLSRARTIP